jgi:hypothetical protein
MTISKHGPSSARRRRKTANSRRSARTISGFAGSCCCALCVRGRALSVLNADRSSTSFCACRNCAPKCGSRCWSNCGWCRLPLIRSSAHHANLVGRADCHPDLCAVRMGAARGALPASGQRHHQHVIGRYCYVAGVGINVDERRQTTPAGPRLADARERTEAAARAYQDQVSG